LISGEPGLEKDNLAALVHFGSPDRQQLMLRFDGALLRPDGSELFGNGAGLVASPESSERPLLELLGAGALLIDGSTIDVESARHVAASASAAGYVFADAPVSGGTAGAEAGTLAFMVGCDEADFARIEALLAPMARAVLRAGDHGAGQAAKICNNMLLGISMIGACEAFALAERLGLEADRFFDIASRSSGQCWSLTSYSPWPGLVETAPSNRGYEGGFAVAMMLKDLKLAQAAAAASGASTPLGAQAEALYALWERHGNGGRDFSSMLQFLRGET
jgi:3-hydroxyisobutyrate dehydrogenase